MGKYRKGKTLVNLWIEDELLATWKKVAGENLSNLIRQAVNEHILRDKSRVEKESQEKVLQDQIALIEGKMDAKFAELTEALQAAKTEVPVRPELKNRILKFIEVAKDPVTFEALVEVLGEGEEVILTALENLHADHLILMDKTGHYRLPGGVINA